MRNESEIPFADNPFTIPVADRMRRLPPYLFAKINKVKYEKRQAGIDVIDLGMGNPTDPPEQIIQDKLAEALADPKNHRYSVANGIGNLRKEVAIRYDRKYGVKLDPRSRSSRRSAPRKVQPHVPGPDGTGRHGDLSISDLPIHTYAVVMAGGNVIHLDVRNPQKFLSNVAYTCEHLYPKPKLVIANFPHNPSSTVIDQSFWDDLVKLAKKYGFLVISDFAYADVCYDGYKAPSFLASPGALDVGVEFTTMSKSYSMAGWRVGFCCGNAEMVRALTTIKGYYDYGIFQAIQIAAIIAMRHCDDAVDAMAKEYQSRRDALCDGLNRLGWNVERPKAACSCGPRFRPVLLGWVRSTFR